MVLSGKMLLECGFEIDDAAAYHDVTISGGVVSNTFAATGSRSYKCANQIYGGFPIGESVTDVGVSFWFYMDDQNGNDSCMLFAPEGANNVPWLRILGNSGTRKLALCTNVPSGTLLTLWTSTATLALDTGYRIQYFVYRQSDAVTSGWPARVKLWNADGSTLLDDSGWKMGQANTVGSFNQIYLGMFTDGGAITGPNNFYYDDLFVCRGAPPPLVKISMVSPTGDSAIAGCDGFVDQAAAASTWEDVDEVTPDDTDYATSNGGSGSTQFWTHGGATDPGSSNHVLGVGVRARGARDAASGTGIMNCRLATSGGTETVYTNSQSIVSTGTFAWARAFRHLSTSEAHWVSGTGSEPSIDDINFGVFKLSATHVKCSTCHMEVAWGTQWANTGDHKFYDNQKVRGVW